ncbi:hypothetical protein EDD85DRAFT_894345, partial [Armillaria nabsnona]
MWSNLQQLVQCASGSQMWSLVRKWSCPKSPASSISLDDFGNTFHSRMNPPSSPSSHIDPVLKSVADLLAESLPDHTEDRSPLQSFSRLVLAADVDRGKEHFEVNGANAAAGVDSISQKDVLAIPTEELVRLFNYCLQSNEIPHAWLLRLQSCLMKLLTLIIEYRVTEWMDNANILPRSQNGFRRGNRTHNNSFILRTTIDRAHADGHVLYVAFVDLENAFPSTDLSVLWTKMRRLGVGGAMYD